MNLVVDCMQVFSGRPLTYFQQGQKSLFLRLFKRCLGNPALAPHRAALRKLLDFAERHNKSRAIWRDCEVYYPIDFMSRSQDAEYFPYLIELLSILLGAKDIRNCRNLPDGYYRLKNAEGKIYRIVGGRLSVVREKIVWRMKDFAADIYLPRDGMFSDILNERLYPRMKKICAAAAIKARLARTVGHMRDFSRDIWEDFQDAVWNVVLLTNTPNVGTSSLTMRYKYFGSVFFNPFMNDEYKGVESLVHEYIHNRCWLWWELARPTGIPPESVRIASPVTGNRVRVSAMIHAFIIYVSALQFYRFVQEGAPPSDKVVRERLNRRASQLARSIPVLNARLSRKVRRGTDIRRLFDYLMTVYEGVV